MVWTDTHAQVVQDFLSAFKCTLLHIRPHFCLCIIDFLVSMFLHRAMHNVASADLFPPPGPNAAHIVVNIRNNTHQNEAAASLVYLTVTDP